MHKYNYTLSNREILINHVLRTLASEASLLPDETCLFSYHGIVM